MPVCIFGCSAAAKAFSSCRRALFAARSLASSCAACDAGLRHPARFRPSGPDGKRQMLATLPVHESVDA